MEGVFSISVMVLIVCTFGKSSNCQTTLNSSSSDDNETLIDELEKRLRSDLVGLGDYDIDGNSIGDRRETEPPYSTAILLQLFTNVITDAKVKTDKTPLPTSSLEPASGAETASVPDTKAVVSPALKRIRDTGIPKNSSSKVNITIDKPSKIDSVAKINSSSSKVAVNKKELSNVIRGARQHSSSTSSTIAETSSTEENTRTYWFTNPAAETFLTTTRDTEDMTSRTSPINNAWSSETPDVVNPSAFTNLFKYSYPLIILIIVVLLLPGIALLLFLIYIAITDLMIV